MNCTDLLTPDALNAVVYDGIRLGLVLACVAIFVVLLCAFALEVVRLLLGRGQPSARPDGVIRD